MYITCFKRLFVTGHLLNLRNILNPLRKDGTPRCTQYCVPNATQRKSNTATTARKGQAMKRFYCNKCNQGFTLKSNCVRHERYECQQHPRFMCPYCRIRCKQTSQIYTHIRKKHPNEDIYVVTIDKQSLIAVPSFYDPFVSILSSNHSSVLMQPRLQRRRPEPTAKGYVCEKCGKSYVFQQSLNRHRRYECGLDPRFLCPYCNYKSKQQTHIKEHVVRKHPNKRVYVIDMLE
ncbi:Krueppel-related zinc finger protein 1-like [Copidosoma floridanum]|uniref:Krueppel-related zinc finger protein 1-like n=1 Tax=Copidosoma floridanum TaxID=29053 RepID=UPI0006C9E586|nr:Krueppel-related zinc finger protein 1-like [Copidosoma floridanum]